MTEMDKKEKKNLLKICNDFVDKKANALCFII